MKKRHFKYFAVAVILLALILPIFISYIAEAATAKSISLNGINIERKLNYLVAYTDEYISNRTKTDDKGIEAVVNSDGIVISVEGNNNEIPHGGFVLSGSGTMKSRIRNIKVGNAVYLDKEAVAFTVIPEDYNPFYSKTIEYNSINGTRYENTLIVYDGSNGKTASGTNEWGYEVVVDEHGFIISVGGNNNQIPEGGLVLSAINNKRELLQDAAQVGMSVKIDTDSKVVTISYSKESAAQAPRLKIDSFKSELNQAKQYYKNINYQAVDDLLDNSEEEYQNIKTALENDDMISFTASQSRFDRLILKIKGMLIENPAVEGRAIWIRPEQRDRESVKKVVEEIYEMGFNIICIEGLYNNTLIMPPPEGSLFSHNPSFKGFDALKAFTEESHKYGIELHLWMPVFRVAHGGSTYPNLGLNKKKPEWLAISNTDKNYLSNQYGNSYYLNPSNDDVKEFLLSFYSYLLENYHFDGLQLDYIRYPDTIDGVDFGYDDNTKKMFFEEYGVDPDDLPSSGDMWNKWCQFRADFVTDFLSQVKALVDEKRPDIYLSADVVPSYDEYLSRTKQDTKAWLENSYIDLIYPMAYGMVDRVRTWTKSTVSLTGDKTFAYMGLGDYGAETLFDEILVTRELGADGISFFSYHQYKNGNYDWIKDTLFSSQAVSPTFNARKAILAQLDFLKSRIKDIIVPSEIEGASMLNELVTDIDILVSKIETSSIAEYKNDIKRLIEDIDSVLEILKDEKAINAVKGDIRVVAKLTNLSKDEEKANYYKNNPLPDMYDLSEVDKKDKDDIDKSSDELTTFERISRTASFIIILISLLGLPLYIILDNRRKRIVEDTNKEDSDENDSSNTDSDEN